MKEDTVYKGSSNKVKYLFNYTRPWTSLGLGIYEKVELIISGEVYSTEDTPSQLYIEDYTDPLGRVWDDAVLVLNIGTTTDIYPGLYSVTISGFRSSTVGEVLTHKNFKLLPTTVK